MPKRGRILLARMNGAYKRLVACSKFQGPVFGYGAISLAQFN